MNKYDLLDLEELSEIKDNELINNLNQNISQRLNCTFKDNLFYGFLLTLSEAPVSLFKWAKDNIISKLNSKYLLENLLINLQAESYSNDKTNLEIYMKSLKLTGIIQNIELNQEEQYFELTTLDGKTYQIKRTLESLEGMDTFSGRCHKVTLSMLKECMKNTDLLGAFSQIDGLFFNTRYHSFLINNKNMVIDLAHNIITNLDFYTDVLGYEILLKESPIEVLNGIEFLKKTDPEFNESNKCAFFKYAISKTNEISKNKVLEMKRG